MKDLRGLIKLNLNKLLKEEHNDNDEEIERTSQDLDIPIKEINDAVLGGEIRTLSERIWSKLENSDSYGISSLADAIRLAKEYGKDWEPTLEAVKEGKIKHPPLILRYDKNKYYLVGGNTRLMFSRALNKMPKIMMATLI